MARDLKANIVLGLTLLVVIAFFAKAILIGSKAIFDSIFTAVLIVLAFSFYERLKLTFPILILAMIFLIFHNAGAAGWYDIKLLGLFHYDKILHFYGPFVLSMLVFNFIWEGKNLKSTLMTAGFITLGINAMQEVVEFLGNNLLGQGEGVFFYGAGDLEGNDTPKDLIANVLGITLATVVMLIKHRRHKNKHF